MPQRSAITQLSTHIVLGTLPTGLQANNSQVVGAVMSVQFGLNEAYILGLTNTRPTSTKPWSCYPTAQATAQQAVNSQGWVDYILSLNDQVWDNRYHYDPATGGNLGNRLDGDYDGIPGTNTAQPDNPNDLGRNGYAFHFTLSLPPQVGSENRVNQTTTYEDQFQQEYGTGYAVDQTTHSVAIDDSGDFAVVWTRYGADGVSDPNSPNYDPNWATDSGVYMRLFDANNNSLTGNFSSVLSGTLNATTNLVTLNSTTGLTPGATIVIDGEHMLVQSLGSDGHQVTVVRGRDGTAAIAHTSTRCSHRIGRYPRSTPRPSATSSGPVAMDADGDFVVVWEADERRPARSNPAKSSSTTSMHSVSTRWVKSSAASSAST